MPAQRKTNQSRGLTAAGLIAVTAATLLMMAWANREADAVIALYSSEFKAPTVMSAWMKTQGGAPSVLANKGA